MTELQQVGQMLRSLPLYVNKNPNGTWGFVGSVPAELNWDTDNEDALRELASSSFPAMTQKALGIR